MEIYVDDEAKLTLHGLVQVLYPCMLIIGSAQKNECWLSVFFPSI